MLNVERDEPVAQRVEEREALHLFETAEIHVGTLFLHVEHLLHRALHLLHLLVGGFGVHDIFHRVVVHLLDAVSRDAEIAVTQNVRHNLALDGLVILVGIDTAYHLLLQFRELLVVCLAEFCRLHPDFGIDVERQTLQAQCPSHEGPFAHLYHCRLLVQMNQQTEFHDVELRETTQRHRTRDELCIQTVDGGRGEQMLVEFPLRTVPLVTHENAVEQQAHEVVVVCVECGLLSPSCLVRLQTEHSRFRHEILHVFLDDFKREHISHGALLRLVVETHLTAEPHHPVVGREVPHTLHQLSVYLVAFSIAVALFHIVEHPSEVILDDLYLLVGEGRRIGFQIAFHKLDGLTEMQLV